MQVKEREIVHFLFPTQASSRSERTQPEKPLHLQVHYFYLYLVQLQSHISACEGSSSDFEYF